MTGTKRKYLLQIGLAALLAASLALTGCTDTGAQSAADPETDTPVSDAAAPEDGGEEPAGPRSGSSSESITVRPNARTDSAEVNAAYLNHYFGVSVSDGMTQGDFVTALNAVQPDEVEADDAGAELSGLDAVKYSVIAAGMEELALVYSSDKAGAVIASYGVGAEESHAQYIACALGTGLLDGALAGQVTDGPAGQELAAALAMSVGNFKGTTRNFIGYSDDADIYRELMNRWDGFTLFEDEKLLNIGVQSVTEKVTTGYNLKYDLNAARFLPELSLNYGHSNIRHAQQLLGLLKSEGIVAKVQLEPKVSIYEFLLEWGEPGDPTPTYKVEQAGDDLYLAHAIEYDLALEFATQEDRARFDGIIQEYAKKNTGEEDKLLLTGAWWQPLYVSHVEMGEGYHQIYDNVVTNDVYSLHPFSLAEAKDEVAEKFKGYDSSVEVESVPIWCNSAFFRYLNGESE